MICKNVLEVQTLWTLLHAEDVATARRHLGLREYGAATPSWIDTHIGFWDRASGASHGEGAQAIAAWAEAKDLAAAVWTNLSCGFKGRRGIMPSSGQIVAHLRGLEGLERTDAEEYIRRTPRRVDTAYRSLIVHELGWF